MSLLVRFSFCAALLGAARSSGAHGESSLSCDPDVFYSSVVGLDMGPPSTRAAWATLYTSLHELLMQTHVIIPYTSSSTDVWDALRVLDADPANPSNVWLLYANRSEPYETHGQSTGWNREHIIPRSYGLFDSGPDYSDLHNLRASDANVNSARSNLYFDNCEPFSDNTCQRPAHSEAAPDTSKNDRKFYPSAYRKGDIARSAFYMALRYNGTEANTEQMKLTDCPCVDTHSFGNLSTLLEWALEDEVDASEIARNNLTCSMFQKNRNPFVDFPWLHQIFSLSPPLSDLTQDCGINITTSTSTYSGDPRQCSTEDINVPPDGDETYSPTVSPGVVGSNAPTSSGVESSSIEVGDVAVIALNSDNPDSFALVALKTIPAGTVIHVTDNGWTANGFRGGEGVLTFTLFEDTSLPAGEVWGYEAGDMTSYTTTYGKWTPSSNFALSVSGDQIFIYTQSYENPFFIYAVSNAWSETDSASSTTSPLPSQLAHSTAYVTLGFDDNAIYNGITIGSQKSLLEMISNQSNWVSSNAVRYDIHTIDTFTVIEEEVSNDEGKNNLFSKSGVVLLVVGLLALVVAGVAVAYTAQKKKKMMLHVPTADNTNLRNEVEVANILHS